jgi:hypothetical protein
MKATGRSDLVDIDGDVRMEREKAILFYDGSREVWLPRSLVEINNDGTITLPEWKAKEAGLI